MTDLFFYQTLLAITQVNRGGRLMVIMAALAGAVARLVVQLRLNFRRPVSPAL